jgi:hypothetical protein
MVSAIHRELLSAHFSTDSLVNCGGPGTLDKGQPGKHMGFGQPPWICLATLLMSQIGTDFMGWFGSQGSTGKNTG